MRRSLIIIAVVIATAAPGCGAPHKTDAEIIADNNLVELGLRVDELMQKKTEQASQIRELQLWVEYLTKRRHPGAEAI